MVYSRDGKDDKEVTNSLAGELGIPGGIVRYFLTEVLGAAHFVSNGNVSYINSYC